VDLRGHNSNHFGDTAYFGMEMAFRPPRRLPLGACYVHGQNRIDIGLDVRRQTVYRATAKSYGVS
jgi:hypothetical protein